MSRNDRRIRCIADPLAFAVTYLSHHIRQPDGEITFSDLHLDLIAYAKSWIRGVPTVAASQRDLFVAPRGMGKSTWLFLILPMWAAAYGHRSFAAAFADSGPQAENHLSTFKHELDTNALLRHDFPELCRPMKRPSGVNVADRHGLYQASSGFVFAARGIDASSLGLKVGSQRPDLIILDDIEPDESMYSAYQKDKRLSTLLDAVLPLNVYATVVIVGTVTMPGSIIHDAVRAHRGEPDPAEWVADEGFSVHYYPAIATMDDGGERSTWPAKWPLDWLQSIRHTRSYAKNYANDPMGRDGEYWTMDDFRYATSLAGVTRTVLSVDPAVTTRTRSDFTGLAVVGFRPAVTRGDVRVKSSCLVRHAEAVKLKGGPLRLKALRILEDYPEITHVIVEANQGGDLWHGVFHDMPVKVAVFSQDEPKEVRAARALGFYQRGRVEHQRRFPMAEEQMVGFPRAPHDDIVDAIGSAVCRFLDRPKRLRAGGTSYTYDG